MSEWRTMAAGRELDRVIAEKLGKEVMIGGSPTNPRLVFKENYGGILGVHEIVPHYSTSVDAALTLMPNDPPRLSGVRLMGLGQTLDGEWEAAIAELDKLKAWHTQVAPTAALAICRAWFVWQEAQGRY
jgi:hypothetical protein